MPKIVSRSQAFQSNRADDKQMNVHHCLCGAHILITDADIFDLPRRKTDDAIALPTASSLTFRLNVTEGSGRIVKRKTGGFEKQYRFYCRECGLLVCYTAERSHAKYTFLLPKSVKSDIPTLNPQ
eukprot:c6021_g1_i1.p1 GENE.c6021_g1_i1~~c6021_g1_i1.p1  ORF type:complete len:138 (+),score=25.83 c6021_g1_i1:42-416(+)